MLPDVVPDVVPDVLPDVLPLAVVPVPAATFEFAAAAAAAAATAFSFASCSTASCRRFLMSQIGVPLGNFGTILLFRTGLKKTQFLPTVSTVDAWTKQPSGKSWYSVAF